jgi:hypothetical protein
MQWEGRQLIAAWFDDERAVLSHSVVRPRFSVPASVMSLICSSLRAGSHMAGCLGQPRMAPSDFDTGLQDLPDGLLGAIFVLIGPPTR